MERYMRLAEPPQDALKEITFGALKGYSDVNPQWRIEAMTREYGECGKGWKFEIVDTKTVPLDDGQILLYMQVNVYTNENGKWSEPIPGYGGDFIVTKNKNGLVPNDEAYKMCLTDALGNALKCLGVAADVYRGLADGKYTKPSGSYAKKSEAKQEVKQEQKQETASNAQKAFVEIRNNETYVLTKAGYKKPSELKYETLKAMLGNEKYAQAHFVIQMVLNDVEAQSN